MFQYVNAGNAVRVCQRNGKIWIQSLAFPWIKGKIRGSLLLVGVLSGILWNLRIIGLYIEPSGVPLQGQAEERFRVEPPNLLQFKQFIIQHIFIFVLLRTNFGEQIQSLWVHSSPTHSGLNEILPLPRSPLVFQVLLCWVLTFTFVLLASLPQQSSLLLSQTYTLCSCVHIR